MKNLFKITDPEKDTPAMQIWLAECQKILLEEIHKDNSDFYAFIEKKLKESL